MGGGTKTQVIQSTPPPAPSVQDNMKAYVEAMPQLLALQYDYAPKEVAQQLNLLQQYGGDYASAYKDIQSQLYPETTKIQEDLARQAQEGYTNGLTESARNMYRDELKSLVGDQVRGGVGADYVSRGLVNQDLNYRQYNQNLALSLAGRQPLTNPYTPQFTNQIGQFSPNDVMGYNAGVYGAQLGFSRPQIAQSQRPDYLGGAGAMLQGVGALAAFCWVASEIFGGWNHPKTEAARFYIKNYAPKWFRDFYIKHGERFAKWMKNKPLVKAMIRPLFEVFSLLGRNRMTQIGGLKA